MRHPSPTLILGVLALVAVACRMTHAERKIVCYVGTWAVYRHGNGRFDIENIDPFLCTHLMYGFFGITEDATVRVIDPYLDLEENWGRGHIKRFVGLKNVNPQLKTLAAVGGWNEGSRKFSAMAASPERRQRFIQDCVRFCQQHGFDGIDLDWEYPAQRDGNPEVDKGNHAILVEEMRKAFDVHGLLLTAAVASVEFSAGVSYDIPRVARSLHFINVMTYDMHGAWDDYCGLNAPLYQGPADVTDKQKQLNVDAAIQYWLTNGAPAEKLILGVPLYGRSFTLANANSNAIGASVNGPGIGGPYSREPGVMGYNEICEAFASQPWELHWSAEQQGSYAVKGNQWLGFENATGIQLKMDYLRKLGLGGAMVWSLESDDFKGACGGVRYPLMRTIYAALNDGAPVPTQSTVPTEATTPTSPPVTHQCGETGIMAHPDDCSKYIMCVSEDLSYEFSCPPGTLFDPVLVACNWADLVSCTV